MSLLDDFILLRILFDFSFLSIATEAYSEHIQTFMMKPYVKKASFSYFQKRLYLRYLTGFQIRLFGNFKHFFCLLVFAFLAQTLQCRRQNNCRTAQHFFYAS